MKPTLLYTLSADPFWAWSAFARNIGEMMLASVQVIGQRSNRMRSAGRSPDAGHRREFALMGQEKIAAAAESVQAMARGWIRLNQEFSAIAFKQMLAGTAAIMSVAASRTPGQSVARQTRLVGDAMTHSSIATSRLSKSTARLANRGLKPIHSRATANARRLGKH